MAQQATLFKITKVFALGGEIVNNPKDAKRILVDAIRTDKHYLIPQAESVLRQLRQGGAA